MNRLILVCFAIALVAVSSSAQTHPYSNAWSYVTSVETGDGQLAATTVAGTGGTDTHLMVQIAIFIQSPGGRTSSAYNYPSQTTGQATAYLPLCGGSGCEDGSYFATSINTTEQCGVTGTVLELPVQTQNPSVTPYISWNSLGFSPSSVPRENGISTLRAKVLKSANCSAANIKVQFTPDPNPAEIQFARDPDAEVKTASFAGNTAETTWKITTAGGNPHAGSIKALSGLIEPACRVVGGELREATLTVSNP